MPGISIITNFDVNANAPLDSRLVVSDAANRNAIQYKYAGLKVYQENDKKTYLWDGATWSLDSGFNGIYGGSGSLIGSTNVNFGPIGNTISNTSYAFRFDTTTATGSNIATMRSVFRRTQTATGVATDQWKSIEFRHQSSFFNGVQTVDGPYISYNASSTTNRRGEIAFGTGDTGALIAPIERVRITNDGLVGINTSDPFGLLQIGSASKMTLVFDTSSTQSHIGANVRMNNLPIVSSRGSSKFEFSDTGAINVFNRSGGSNFTQSMSINGNVVRIINDASANSWDGNASINYQLQTIPDYLHNSEHRYTKIQIDNWYKLPTSSYDDTNKWLLITDNANTFEIDIQPGVNKYIKDIKILRNGLPSDLPKGTKLDIKFKHIAIPSGTNNFYLKLGMTAGDSSSNFRSVYTDLIAGGSTYSLTINHSPSTSPLNMDWSGEVISFIKGENLDGGPEWDVTNVERLNQVLPSGFQSLTSTDFDLSDMHPSMDLVTWQFRFRKLGDSYFCSFLIRATFSSPSVSSSGYFYPRPGTYLHGKTPLQRLLKPGIGYVGGVGTNPFQTLIDLYTTQTLVDSGTGWGFRIARLDFATSSGYGFFTQSIQTWVGEFVI